jgi:formate hydrogenlyase subunit 4
MAMSETPIIQAAQAVLILALAPLLTGMVRKSKARLQRRCGPSVFQPYRDIARLMRKEAAISHDASWIFTGAPTFILGATWIAAAMVPLFAFGGGLSAAADLIVIIALLTAARFAQALAGLDVGTAFGGLGASREMMFATIAEPAILMVIFALALISGTTRLPEIASFIQAAATGPHISLLLAFVGLAMLAVSENGRIPVDNPATHLELTMVHEAMVLEYSGRHLALIELAHSLKLIFFISLIAALFIPWGIAQPGSSPLMLGVGFAAYLVKLFVAAKLLALFEIAVAKMRVFRVPQFVGVALMLGLLAVLLVFVSRGL